METVNLTIRKIIRGEPVRYHLEVTQEVADRYFKIIEEYPDLTEMEAYEKAKENSQS